MLLASDTNFPLHALNTVRYHSLYVWHDCDEYAHLENDSDVLLKGWIKLFNAHDLYSKKNSWVDLQLVKPYYEELAKKYIPHGLRF